MFYFQESRKSLHEFFLVDAFGKTVLCHGICVQTPYLGDTSIMKDARIQLFLPRAGFSFILSVLRNFIPVSLPPKTIMETQKSRHREEFVCILLHFIVVDFLTHVFKHFYTKFFIK